MKNSKYLTLFVYIILVAGFSSCIHHNKSKEATWSDAEKTKWKTECQQLLGGRGIYAKDAKSFCDCMLKKTSEKYTPAEAAKITTDEERKICQECDYQW